MRMHRSLPSFQWSSDGVNAVFFLEMGWTVHEELAPHKRSNRGVGPSVMERS